MNGKLIVLTGVQQGAEASLIEGVSLSIGSSFDDDVILRHSTVERQHASLLLDQNRITLSCLSGDCLADGVNIAAGHSVSLEDNMLLQIGEIGVSIQCLSSSAEEPSPHDMVEPVRSTTTSDELETPEERLNLNPQAAFLTPPVDDLPAVAEATGERLPADQARRSTGKWIPGVLTVSVLLIGACIVWQLGLQSKQPVEEFMDLESAVSVLSLAGLKVEQSGRVATVSGYVDTPKESRQLQQLLNQTGLQVTNVVVVGEALGDQIVDIFRVHGIAADVQVSDGFNVVVATNEADLELLNDVENRVRQDIPAVASLVINNIPPAVAEPTAPSPVVDPGKRVAMVVSDEPAYIVTEDQSRYFIGSLLPTGHRIKAIADGVVSLVKNGVTTTLEL